MSQFSWPLKNSILDWGIQSLMEAIVFAADPITWKSQDPVWVEQWPLTKEKLLAAKALISEQLELGHIEPSNSPWNTAIFGIMKKSGK